MKKLKMEMAGSSNKIYDAAVVDELPDGERGDVPYGKAVQDSVYGDAPVVPVLDPDNADEH